MPQLTNVNYSPQATDSFLTDRQEVVKSKFGFYNLCNFTPADIPLVDRQGRGLSRQIINEQFLPVGATKTINGDSVSLNLISLLASGNQAWQRSDGADVEASDLDNLTFRKTST